MRINVDHDLEFADGRIRRQLPPAAVRKMAMIIKRRIAEGKMTSMKTKTAAILLADAIGDDHNAA